MAMSDPLGDMLTRIRNGQRNGSGRVEAPASKLRANVLEVLKREGYIRDFSVNDSVQGLGTIEIQLKYHDGRPVIQLTGLRTLQPDVMWVAKFCVACSKDGVRCLA